MIKNIILKEALKTGDGSVVNPGNYPVTSVLIENGSREERHFFLDGFDGIFISQCNLTVLKEFGKIDFS